MIQAERRTKGNLSNEGHKIATAQAAFADTDSETTKLPTRPKEKIIDEPPTPTVDSHSLFAEVKELPSEIAF